MKKQFLTIPPLTLIWGLVFILAGIWGSSYLLLKKALLVFTPLEVIAGRMFFASILSLPFALKEIRRIPRDKWVQLVGFAFIANFLVTFLNAWAQSEISSSLNGVLSALTPLMTLLIGGVCYRVLIRKFQIWGILIGLVGTTILTLYAPGNELGQVNTFAIVAVLATFFTGLTANMIRFNLEGLSPLQIASVAFLIILPFAATYTFSSDFIPKALESSQGQEALLYIILLAVFANVVAILIFTKLIELSSPVFASLVNYLVPLIALGWGIWDGELVNSYQLLGMSIIILSVWIVGRVVNPQQDQGEEIE